LKQETEHLISISRSSWRFGSWNYWEICLCSC